jgi:hypothetical protein
MKSLLYAATFLVMSLTVPWFFSAEPDAASTGPVVGLPRWVIYNVGASVFYAAMVAGLIHYAWNTSAGSSEEKDTEPADRHDGGAGQ